MSAPQMVTPAAGRAQQYAQAYLRLTSNVASAIVGLAVLAALGFSPLPVSFPLIGLARSTPVVAIALGAILLVGVLAAAVRIRVDPQAISGARLGGGAIRFFVSSVVSALGSACVGILLGFGSLPAGLPVVDALRGQTTLGVALLALLLLLII